MKFHAPLALAAFLAVLASAPAHAVYRCEVNGQVSFQDRPCPEGSQSKTVRSDAPPPLVSAPDDSQRAQAVQRSQESSARSLRKSQLESGLLPAAQSAFASHRDACDKELAELRTRRDGTTPRLPAQVQAAESALVDAQARCDRQGRELADKLETLRAECAALQCSAR